LLFDPIVNYFCLTCYYKFKESTSKRPQLQLVIPHMDDYEVISSDALSIRGYEEYKSNDYHLGKNNL